MSAHTAKFVTLFRQLREHNGESVAVLRELGDDQRDPEVGRMFHVRFEDGTTADVFEDELEEE